MYISCTFSHILLFDFSTPSSIFCPLDFYFMMCIAKSCQMMVRKWMKEWKYQKVIYLMEFIVGQWGYEEGEEPDSSRQKSVGAQPRQN